MADIPLGFREYRDGPYRVRRLGSHIIAHQGICHGQPTFRGTRVLVHLVLESLAAPGETIESVAAAYDLPAEAISEAVGLAARLTRDELRLPAPKLWDGGAPLIEAGIASARTVQG